MLYSNSDYLRYYYTYHPNDDVMNTDFATLNHIVPAYINKDSISTIKQSIFEESLDALGETVFREKCDKHGILMRCDWALSEHVGLQNVDDAFLKDVSSMYFRVYEDDDLCLKILFTAKY